MAQKTWLPALVHIMNRLCTYINNNRLFLDRFIVGSEGQNKLDAVLHACIALTEFLEPLLPVDT